MPNFQDFQSWLTTRPLQLQKFNQLTTGSYLPSKMLEKLADNFQCLDKYSRTSGSREWLEILKLVDLWKDETYQQREKHEVLKEWVLSETRERETRQGSGAKRKQSNNMYAYQNNFQEWLNANPSRKRNLPHWEEFFNFDFDEAYMSQLYDENYVINKLWKWEQEKGQLFVYLEIYQKWYVDAGKLSQLPNEGRGDNLLQSRLNLIDFSRKIYQSFQEIKGLKAAKEELETKIQDLKIELTDEKDKSYREKNLCNYLFKLYEKATANPENIAALTAEAKQEVTEVDENDSEPEEEVVNDFYQKIDKIMAFARQKNNLSQKLQLAEQKITDLEQELGGLRKLNGELNQLKQEKEELETKLSESESSLTETRQKLDKWKKEFTNQEQALNSLKEKLTTEQIKFSELETQLTALAVSSGLLSQQVENLTQQLTKSEQKEERTRLEAEIKSNLIREQNEKISQQTNQITNYQNLLRRSEENLKKCQQIISQKGEQIENLEKEKNLIGEELSLASSKIKELESALLSANGKVVRLEAKVRDLESQNNNSEELERLKKELSTEKQKSQQERNKSQSEIRRLQSELAATKKREGELAAKIKELSTKKVKTQLAVSEKSFWETIKQPLLYTVGIFSVAGILGWIWSKLEQ